MELQEVMNQINEQKEQLAWEGTFRDYFAMAVNNPDLARLAHARIYNSIMADGTEPNLSGETVYRIFSQELYGINQAIEQVVEYFRASARGFDTRKRILLLMGPPASGKSTLVNLIKEGLERYTRTPEGAVYAIAGCPMQEEPLHLIPPDFREEIREKYGLVIEGDLCPHCRWMLDNTYHGVIDKVKVKRVTFSEQMGIGIGIFVASDPGSEDIARLIGSIDDAQQSTDRIENFGKAYRLNGELNVANRGLAEFIEVFKLDERFLTVLLVLSEEQKIKAPGFGTLYADEAIIAHTNEMEYESMVANPKTEGLQDRMVVVHVPYNLRVSDEVRIYEKMLSHVDLKGVYLSPLCLPLASTFAVLSRLQTSERMGGLSPLKKLRLYDGQFVEGQRNLNLEDIRAESPREGLFGISPRFVINQISRSATVGNRSCLDPLELLKTLWEGVEQSTSLAKAERQRLYRLFLDTRRAYDQMAVREVQKALVPDFQRRAAQMVEEYLSWVKRWMDNGADENKGKTPIDPSGMAVLRNMETAVQIQDYDAAAFRKKMYATSQAIDGEQQVYTIPTLLDEAVVRRLCPGEQSVIGMVAGRSNSFVKSSWNRAEVEERLVKEHGYEAECAASLLDYVATLNRTGLFSRSGLSKNLRWLRED